MKRLALIIAFVLSPVLDVVLSAQNEIAVVGCVLDKTDKTPIKNVRVWAYNTSYEAKDKKIYLEKMIKANSTDLINMEGIECDLYKMLAGDRTVIGRYNGEYLTRFVWAEERRKQLDKIKKKTRF